MNYLTYEEYTKIGGTLDDTAFATAERKARYLINSQAGGRTGERIGKLTELPQAVKDCTFDLISLMSAYSADEKQIASESQSQGGSSESYAYETKTDEEVSQTCTEIIEQYLYGGGLGYLLYRGACI